MFLVDNARLLRDGVLMLCSRVPVLHEVRDITMARTGDVALVSYENKVSLPDVSDVRHC